MSKSRTLRSATARFCVTVFAASATLVGGATIGQANVRPNSTTPCTVTQNTNYFVAPGNFIPDNFAYCINGWKYIAQNDGNFVIYNSSGRAVWASNTDVGYGLTAKMQADGNFVIYNGATALWSTGTAGYTNAYLCFQVDGNMVVYSPDGGRYTCNGEAQWASGT